MADPVAKVVDEHGNFISKCLHREGFPLILWEVLSTVGYAYPPQYVGREFEESGVTRCPGGPDPSGTPLAPGVACAGYSGHWSPFGRYLGACSYEGAHHFL